MAAPMTPPALVPTSPHPPAPSHELPMAGTQRAYRLTSIDMLRGLVISTAATFAPGGIEELGGQVLIGMQVIWAIGASMIVLAGCQWMGRRTCLGLGLTILVAHNLLDAIWPAATQLELQWPLWVALHAQMAVAVGPFLFLFLFLHPLLPWIGVMLLGFGIA